MWSTENRSALREAQRDNSVREELNASKVEGKGSGGDDLEIGIDDFLRETTKSFCARRGKRPIEVKGNDRGHAQQVDELCEGLATSLLRSRRCCRHALLLYGALGSFFVVAKDHFLYSRAITATKAIRADACDCAALCAVLMILARVHSRLATSAKPFMYEVRAS